MESAGGPRVLTIGDDDLLGNDKWLGGVASPCGRYVFGVPGKARRVLRIDVETRKVDEVGPEYLGKFKWLRGVEVPADALDADEHPCGCALALPSNANSVLKITPKPNGDVDVHTFGGPFNSSWMWHGGNLAPNGFVYCCPANAEQVLKIVPQNETTCMIGPVFTGKQKWYGSLYSEYNKCVYCIPQNASKVLKINTVTDECTLIGDDLGESGWKYHGGLISPDGRICIGFCNNSDYVLKVDCVTDQTVLLGGPDVVKSGRHRLELGGKNPTGYKYLGGALSTSGICYMFPCDAEKVLGVDLATDRVFTTGPELFVGCPEQCINKFQNGFCASDGCCYAIPQRSDSVIRVLPSGEVQLIPCPDGIAGCKEKFEGGVMAKNGNIYCIPLKAKRVLEIVPSGLAA